MTALRIRQMEVFPESTCPRTPMLMLRHLLGWIVDTYSFVISSSYFSILRFIEEILSNMI